jgi:hypothetical protein
MSPRTIAPPGKGEPERVLALRICVKLEAYVGSLPVHGVTFRAWGIVCAAPRPIRLK